MKLTLKCYNSLSPEDKQFIIEAVKSVRKDRLDIVKEKLS